MKIVKHPPITRGVTELMYVGDDEAVEKATSVFTPGAKLALASMATGLWLAYFGKTTTAKQLGTVLALAPVGVEIYLHSKGRCLMDS